MTFPAARDQHRQRQLRALRADALKRYAALRMPAGFNGRWTRRQWAHASLLATLVALLGAGLDFTLGPLKFVDFVYIAGYLGFLCWLTLAARAIGAAPQVGAYLDTTALTIGAGLALWVVVLSPLVGGSQLPQAILLSAYPMADILLLALTARLAMRQGRYLPAMAWFLASVGFLVALDICISLAVVFTPEGRIPALSGAYIFFFAGVAMSTSHPSVARLTRRPPGGPAHRRGSRRTALIVLTISPAILATVMPLNGPVDGVVRGGLVAIVLVLLFVRLSRTLSACRAPSPPAGIGRCTTG